MAKKYNDDICKICTANNNCAIQSSGNYDECMAYRTKKLKRTSGNKRIWFNLLGMVAVTLNVISDEIIPNETIGLVATIGNVILNFIGKRKDIK